jgi:hypothetical protein
MDIKIGGKKNKKNKPSFSWNMLGSFWNNYYKVFFGIVIIGVLVAGGYIWYKSLYEDAWSQQAREEYRLSKKSGVIFNEEKFLGVLDSIDKRRLEYLNVQTEIKDVFKKY